jgi:hypothetical protein
MVGWIPLYVCPAPSCDWRTPVLAGACLGHSLELVCARGHVWYAGSTRIARCLLPAE